MNLYQLSYFQEIVDSGSMSAAALKLRISQSALSQSLKLLEESLGQRLFERRARRLLITEAGEILYRRMKGISRQIHDAQHEIDDLKAGLGGTVHWGAPEFLCAYYLHRVMKTVFKAMPQVRHTLRSSHSDALRDLVVREEISFAIIAGYPQRSAELVYLPLLVERFPLYLATRHSVLKGGRRPKLEDLVDIPMLRSYAPRNEGLAAIDQAMARAKFFPRRTFQIESFELRRQMLLSGMGMGFFPQTMFAAEESRGRVQALRFFEPVDLQYSLVTKKDKYLPRATRHVMDLIQVGLAKR